MNRAESTTQGIANAQSRGVVWGRHGAILAARNKVDAREFAESLRPLLLELMRVCRLGPRRLARKLNERGIPARGGGRWYPVTAHRLLERLGPSFEEERKRRIHVVIDRSLGRQPE